jgi:hypothetical protein
VVMAQFIGCDARARWTHAEPTMLDSPTAPATIARIPSTGDLLLIWNNRPPARTHMQDRFPLTAAISRDEGQTWAEIRNLDDTPGSSLYQYPVPAKATGRSSLTTPVRQPPSAPWRRAFSTGRRRRTSRLFA